MKSDDYLEELVKDANLLLKSVKEVVTKLKEKELSLKDTMQAIQRTWIVWHTLREIEEDEVNKKNK